MYFTNNVNTQASGVYMGGAQLQQQQQNAYQNGMMINQQTMSMQQPLPFQQFTPNSNSFYPQQPMQQHPPPFLPINQMSIQPYMDR